MKISEQVQSKAISIHEILKDSNKVNIPFFQRQYVWKFDEHIINLINDITLNNTAYYLGSVIFKSKFDKYLIIDGQQRFTTLLLISKSLYLHELLNEKNKLEIEYILNEIKFDSFNVQNKNTLKKILSLQQSVFDEKQKNTSYYVNFNKILDYFKKWDAKKINHFYSNLYQKTFITRTIIENSLDENIIFSKINSTGEALTAIDMFKNNILSKISEEKKSIDSSYDEEEFIKQKLESFETTTSYLEKPNEKDNLLRNFIAYKTFRLENKQAKKIYNSYLKLIEQENEFEHFFDSFIEFGLYQKYLIQSQKYLSKDLNPVELSIIKNNIQTFIVLLIDIFKKFSKYYKTELEIKINDSKDRDNIRECLKVIEYYIISKAFVGDSLKVITRLIPAIHKENKKINNSSNYHEYLYDVLINSSLIDDDKNQYKSPTKSKFRHDFLTFDIYKKIEIL